MLRRAAHPAAWGIIGRKACPITSEKARDTMTFTPDFALWPIPPFGGEDDKTDNSGESNGTGGNSGAAASGKDNQEDSSKGDKGGATGKKTDDVAADDDEYEGYSSKELKRIARDNAKKARDAQADAQKLKDKEEAEERKKNDDVTNLTNDKTKLQSENTTLRATVAKLSIEGAIRDDKRFEWHDVEMVATVAAKLAADGLKVDDNGKVEGLKPALTKVAKEHPFMLSKDNSQENNDGKGNGNNRSNSNASQQNSGPTGFQPGQGGTSNGAGNEPDEKKLAEFYPVLAGRS